MRNEYDFSDAKRENPYIDRIRQHGYAIVINCGVAQDNLNNSGDEITSVDSVAEYKAEYERDFEQEKHKQ